MPILAICPYCREGKVRAPDQALGLSATCPKCLNCFTIVPSRELPAAAPGGKPGLAATTPPAAKTGAASTPNPIDAGRSTAVTVEEPTPLPDSIKVSPAEIDLVPDYQPAFPTFPVAGRPESESAFSLALFAIVCAGIGLGVSQVPYGRIGTVVLCGLGLILGLGSLFVAERQRLWPAVGSILNAVALLVVLAAPSWLGIDSWWPASLNDDSTQIKSVPFDGSVARADNNWVDVTSGYWQQGDVRISVAMVTVGPVELQGPNNKKKVPKEKVMIVAVRIANIGAARRIDYRSWNEPTPPEAAPIRLQDQAGKPLALKTFDTGWDVPGKNQGAALLPGKFADDFLIFEAPPATVELLRLELPSAAFGNAGAVRLHIPRSMISFR